MTPTDRDESQRNPRHALASLWSCREFAFIQRCVRVVAIHPSICKPNAIECDAEQSSSPNGYRGAEQSAVSRNEVNLAMWAPQMPFKFGPLHARLSADMSANVEVIWRRREAPLPLDEGGVCDGVPRL